MNGTPDKTVILHCDEYEAHERAPLAVLLDFVLDEAPLRQSAHSLSWIIRGQRRKRPVAQSTVR